jgi:hypothetical protein
MTNILNEFAARKIEIDNLADDLEKQLGSKASQIREANVDSPNLPQWRAEMECLQDRLGSEPEEATHSLCDEI